MPISPRMRSSQARARDDEVLDAAVTEIRESGLDSLGMRAVARRVGLTAGAVYSRHETVGELMVAVWQHRCSKTIVDLILAVAQYVETGGVEDFDRWTADDAVLITAIEIVSVASRHPELAEVVIPDIESALNWETRSPLERSRLAFVLGFFVGRSIYSGVDRVNPELWRAILGFVLPATRVEPTTLNAAWKPDLGRAVRAETGEALRDALVNAACDVIGAVGLEPATNSRISRRAGLTPGAVYTIYSTKDELLIDSIRLLLDVAIRDNSPVTSHAWDRSRMGEVSAHLLSRGGGAARRPWLRFRLEVYIAALHRPDLASVLAEIHALGRHRYGDMLSGSGLPDGLVDLVALVGQSIPLGLAVIDRYVDGIELVDYRPVTEPLLGSVARLAQE